MLDGKMWYDKGGDIDDLSTDILKAVLVEDLSSEPSERLSPETLKRIVKLIREREEKSAPHKAVDVTAAWEKFEARYLFNADEVSDYASHAGTEEVHRVKMAQGGSGRIHRYHAAIRKRIVIAAAVGILLAGAVVAQAAGLDVFGAIGRWTSETFNFVSSPASSTPSSSDYDLPSKDDDRYMSLQSALDECGITEALSPTWYPDKFEASEPQISTSDLGDQIYILFNGPNERFFSIDIKRYHSPSDIDTCTFEKNDRGVEVYTGNQKTFYIMSNVDTTTATWSNEQLIESISGNISISEVKTMIDSIGGVK